MVFNRQQIGGTGGKEGLRALCNSPLHTMKYRYDFRVCVRRASGKVKFVNVSSERDTVNYKCAIFIKVHWNEYAGIKIWWNVNFCWRSIAGNIIYQHTRARARARARIRALCISTFNNREGSVSRHVLSHLDTVRGTPLLV